MKPVMFEINAEKKITTITLDDIPIRQDRSIKNPTLFTKILTLAQGLTNYERTALQDCLGALETKD